MCLPSLVDENLSKPRFSFADLSFQKVSRNKGIKEKPTGIVNNHTNQWTQCSSTKHRLLIRNCAHSVLCFASLSVPRLPCLRRQRNEEPLQPRRIPRQQMCLECVHDSRALLRRDASSLSTHSHRSKRSLPYSRAFSQSTCSVYIAEGEAVDQNVIRAKVSLF